MTARAGVTRSRRDWLAAGLALVLLPRAGHAAHKPLVAEDDRRIEAGNAELPGASGRLRAYYARPATRREPMPGVVLLPESRGLTPYMTDVARRLAVSGYAVLAPDFLSPLGGTPEDSAQAREMTGSLDTAQAAADAVAALVWLKGRAECTGKVGAVGFGWGGGLVLRLATLALDLDAGVAFYGKPPPAHDAEHVRAPLLIHKAELDTRNNEADFEAALQSARHPAEIQLYPKVDASFHNDTIESRFDAAAAKLAWERTLAFLKTHLAAG